MFCNQDLLRQANDAIEAGEKAEEEGTALMEDDKGERCTLEEAEQYAKAFQEMYQNLTNYIRRFGPTTDYKARQQALMKQLGFNTSRPFSNPIVALQKSMEAVQ